MAERERSRSRAHHLLERAICETHQAGALIPQPQKRWLRRVAPTQYCDFSSSILAGPWFDKRDGSLERLMDGALGHIVQRGGATSLTPCEARLCAGYSLLSRPGDSPEPPTRAPTTQLAWFSTPTPDGHPHIWLALDSAHLSRIFLPVRIAVVSWRGPDPAALNLGALPSPHIRGTIGSIHHVSFFVLSAGDLDRLPPVGAHFVGQPITTSLNTELRFTCDEAHMRFRQPRMLNAKVYAPCTEAQLLQFTQTSLATSRFRNECRLASAGTTGPSTLNRSPCCPLSRFSTDISIRGCLKSLHKPGSCGMPGCSSTRARPSCHPPRRDLK